MRSSMKRPISRTTVVLVAATVLAWVPAGTYSAAADAPNAVLDRLAANGLRLSTDQRSCVAAERNRVTPAKKVSKNSTPGSVTADDPVGAILGCISQDEAIRFVAQSLTDLDEPSIQRSNAFAPNTPDPTPTCLARRLRVATWPEVSEAFRSYAEAVLANFAQDTRALLASRVRSYATSCAVVKDKKGAAPLRPISLDDVRVRWNASLRRRSSTFLPIARWSKSVLSSTMEAGIAPTSSLTVSISEGQVGGATIVLGRAAASEESAVEALHLIAEVFDGRDQAVIVGREVNVSVLVAAKKAGESRIRIGRTAYVVSVAVDPIRVLITAVPS